MDSINKQIYAKEAAATNILPRRKIKEFGFKSVFFLLESGTYRVGARRCETRSYGNVPCYAVGFAVMIDAVFYVTAYSFDMVAISSVATAFFIKTIHQNKISFRCFHY